MEIEVVPAHPPLASDAPFTHSLPEISLDRQQLNRVSVSVMGDRTLQEQATSGNADPVAVCVPWLDLTTG